MVNKKISVFLMSLFIIQFGYSQPDTLNIRECYQQAKELSPLKKQELLNEHIYEMGVQNHQSNYLPSLSLNGKFTYQSEVITFPGFTQIPDYPIIPKEQFQASLDLNQIIYDGGLTAGSKRIEESEYMVKGAELQTELYALHSNINNLYFSILNLQERKKILETTYENLENQKKQVEASVRNGVVLESNLFQIDKRLLSLEQEIITVDSDRKAFLKMLSEWIGQPINDNTILYLPEFNSQEKTVSEIDRPENELFLRQRSLIESRKSMAGIGKRPKVSAFAQGGIGQPNPVNFFEVDPSTYYILGLRLNWLLYDWGNTSRKKQILTTQKEILTTREEDFNRKLNITLLKLYDDVSKLGELMEKDREIIALQEKIVQTAFSEFQHGVITSTEYLTEMNSLTEAEIKMALHEVQLSNTYVTIMTVSGNEF